MRCDIKLLTIIAAGAAICACAPVDPGMGEALRYDMAVQTIDPDPAYPEDGAKPGSNGEVGAAASQRYRKGNVKTVSTEGTSGAGGPR